MQRNGVTCAAACRSPRSRATTRGHRGAAGRRRDRHCRRGRGGHRCRRRRREWLAGSGLETPRRRSCATTRLRAAPGVYAAGDCARWVNNLFGDVGEEMRDRALDERRRTGCGRRSQPAVASSPASMPIPYAPVPVLLERPVRQPHPVRRPGSRRRRGPRRRRRRRRQVRRACTAMAAGCAACWASACPSWSCRTGNCCSETGIWDDAMTSRRQCSRNKAER